MSRILLVFHSRTGTARKVALDLAGKHDWALGEIEARRPAAGFLRCMAQALLHLRPPIAYDGPDPAAFDIVVLLSPVWCGTLAGPMRSFLAKYGGAIRSHAVLMVMGGSGELGAMEAIDELLGRPALATSALRQATVLANGHQQALSDFARRVSTALEPTVHTPVREAA